MKYRRRHRWFRRFAIGLAFATFAAPAAAHPDASGGSSGHADQAIADPYLTDVFVRQGESLGGADGHAITPFAHGNAPSRARANSGTTVEWDLSASLGGAIVLALALGLAFHYARRSKLAGF